MTKSPLERSPTPRTVIPIYRPDISGNERSYVDECLATSWISSHGTFVDRFERACQAAIGIEHAIAVTNGTVALHLAFHCLDIGPGDEVIVPTFTYIASVNTIKQTGATPVFVECNADDWLIDVEDVVRKITPRTKAIAPVHLYGRICDLAAIGALAKQHGFAIVEDAAEAFGSRLNGQHAGTFGEIGTFSFFGNKTVTTGEGGLVVTRSSDLAERLRRVKGQGQSLTRRYWHTELGFNYRMTNICAAIGVAQLERFPQLLARKSAIAVLYNALLADLPVEFQKMAPGLACSEWLVSLLLPRGVDRDAVMERMLNLGVETRPAFHCAHQMPMYDTGASFPVSEDISARGISLPSYPGLADEEVRFVVSVLRQTLAACSRAHK
jgi:perosamine synthetase